jgi:hypothetical protein
VSNSQVIRNALAAQVGLYAFPALRSLPDPEDQINPPVGIVMPSRQYVNYVTTLEGQGFGPVLGGVAEPLAPTDFTLDYYVLISHASTLGRVEASLDQWLGKQNDGTAVSVVAAVARDPTLGGVVAWCVPTTADQPGPITWNGVEFFGTRIHFSLSAL